MGNLEEVEGKNGLERLFIVLDNNNENLREDFIFLKSLNLTNEQHLRLFSIFVGVYDGGWCDGFDLCDD